MPWRQDPLRVMNVFKLPLAYTVLIIIWTPLRNMENMLWIRKFFNKILKKIVDVDILTISYLPHFFLHLIRFPTSRLKKSTRSFQYWCHTSINCTCSFRGPSSLTHICETTGNESARPLHISSVALTQLLHNHRSLRDVHKHWPLVRFPNRAQTQYSNIRTSCVLWTKYELMTYAVA